MTPATTTYFIHTLGCQMNESDSERFATIIENLGYRPVKNLKQADLIIFNTCSVRQSAENRVFGFGNIIEKLKTKNKDLKVVLTGCMVRRAWKNSESTKTRTKELKRKMPWLDIIIETKDFPKLSQSLGMNRKQNTEIILEKVRGAEHCLSFKPKYKNSFQAYVPISTGCNHFCTYCIVPYARGIEICRTAESIILEVFNLVKNGYKDITLLGQTVNRWVNPEFDQEIKKGSITETKIPGLNSQPLLKKQLEQWAEFFSRMTAEIPADLQMPKDFLQLLQILDQIPGEWWTTWLSSHPNYMTEELIKFIGKSTVSDHQRPYMHFALQSGSDKILKRMNRKHDYTHDFRNIVKKMRKHIPDLTLSTDIIVGFPGETEEDFQETVKAMQKLEFDMAYISEFSPRKGTAASLLKDNVSKEVKSQRKKFLNDEVLAKSAEKRHKEMLGSVQTVLIEGIDTKTRELTGRTAGFKTTRIVGKADKNLIGEFVGVKITDCTPWGLRGVV